MQSQKPKFSSSFYEDADDPLVGFRKKYGGALFVKKGGDPFSKDPDVLQSQRQEKLIKDMRSVDTTSY